MPAIGYGSALTMSRWDSDAVARIGNARDFQLAQL